MWLVTLVGCFVFGDPVPTDGSAFLRQLDPARVVPPGTFTDVSCAERTVQARRVVNCELTPTPGSERSEAKDALLAGFREEIVANGGTIDEEVTLKSPGFWILRYRIDGIHGNASVEDKLGKMWTTVGEEAWNARQPFYLM